MLGTTRHHRTRWYASATWLTTMVASLPLGIVLLLLGTDHMDHPCLVTSAASVPNLAEWMIAEGAFLCGLACLLILVAPLLLTLGGRKSRTGHYVDLAFYPVLLFLQLFHLSWLFIGAQRTGEDQFNCSRDSVIYHCNVAALVIGFFTNFMIIWLAA